jgi:hypothetical protein
MSRSRASAPACPQRRGLRRNVSCSAIAPPPPSLEDDLLDSRASRNAPISAAAPGFGFGAPPVAEAPASRGFGGSI